MEDYWRPTRPGPASNRDSVTRQTLRAGISAPPPEKPYLCADSCWLYSHAHAFTGVRTWFYGSNDWIVCYTRRVCVADCVYLFSSLFFGWFFGVTGNSAPQCWQKQRCSWAHHAVCIHTVADTTDKPERVMRVHVHVHFDLLYKLLYKFSLSYARSCLFSTCLFCSLIIRTHWQSSSMRNLHCTIIN